MIYMAAESFLQT